MMIYPDETSEFDANSIRIILFELDPDESNLLIAYYAVCDCSPTALGKIIGIKSSYISTKIKNILKKIQTLNDTPKSHYNLPRKCADY